MNRPTSTARLRLGVVIPTLNEVERIGALVERLSAPESDDGADLVVVVDGGSQDGTLETARSAGAVVVEAPRGRGAQLAAGAERVLADPDIDLLLFLHADSWPGGGALEAVRREFARDPELVSTGMRQRIRAVGRWYRWIERTADWRVRRLGLVWGDSGLAVRAAAYQDSGGFAPLEVFEDVDLTRRLRRRGPVGFVGGAELSISARRWQRDGPLRRTFGNWMLFSAYLLGVPPAKLAGRYPPEPPRDST